MEVLIIGLGSIAQKHIEALRCLPQKVNIHALRSNTDSPEIDGVRSIFCLDQLNLSPDFAIISNPTHLHFETIMMMVKMNIPMFVEKPVVHNSESIEKLKKVFDSNKVFNYVACNLRFHPCIKFLKSKIESPAIVVNEVNIYCGSYLPDWRPGKNYKEVYSANTNMGGGVHLDLFHEIDYANWIFGKPENYWGYQSNRSSLKIDSIDYANYLLSYDHFNISIVLNYYRKVSKRCIEIILEDDIWSADLIENRITNSKNEIIFEAKDYQLITSYKDQMEYFVHCLQADMEPMNTVADSLQLLKICLDNEFSRK